MKMLSKAISFGLVLASLPVAESGKKNILSMINILIQINIMYGTAIRHIRTIPPELK